ncbi:MAG: 6-bladed beta-propeller [Acidobacteriota bacterium]|jgi:hypothetical protein|nr:6-bladed beta-propeller [Acidobacteriota bacterium]
MKDFKIVFVLILLFVYPVLCKEMIPLKIDGVVTHIKLDKDDFYLFNQSDSSIWRFDKSLHFVNKIGRSGEGPGEISVFSGFSIIDGQLYVQSGSKIMIFDPNGNLIEEMRIPRTSKFHVFDNRNMVEYAITSPKDHSDPSQQVENLYLCDWHFNRKKLIFSTTRTVVTPGFAFEAFVNTLQLTQALDGSGLLFNQPDKGILFNIIDQNGNIVRTVQEKNESRMRITDRFKKAFETKLMSDPRMKRNKEMALQLFKQIHFPKHFPEVHSVHAAPGGVFYIRTYTRKNNMLLYKKYSSEGRFIADLWLEDDSQDIFESKNLQAFAERVLFYLQENQDGELYMVKVPLPE